MLSRDPNYFLSNRAKKLQIQYRTCDAGKKLMKIFQNFDKNWQKNIFNKLDGKIK